MSDFVYCTPLLGAKRAKERFPSKMCSLMSKLFLQLHVPSLYSSLDMASAYPDNIKTFYKRLQKVLNNLQTCIKYSNIWVGRHTFD